MKKIVMCIAAGLMIGFIFYHSLQPVAESERYSQGVLAVICNLLHQFSFAENITDHMVRKAAHFSEFMLLAVIISCSCDALRVRWRTGSAYILLICLFTAVLDENIQLFVPGRSGMVQDVLLDFSGSFTGMAVYLLVRAAWRCRCR